MLILGTVLFWQNCSKVKLERKEASIVQAQGIEESFLKLPKSTIQEFRAAIIIDMSNSMFSGACPDSLDIAIDNVLPSINCTGPTGVDPEGKRFKLILQWIDETEKKISESNGKIKKQNIKLMLITFSNSMIDQYWSLENSYYSSSTVAKTTVANRLIKNLGLENEITSGYISLAAARNYTYLIWAMFNHYHGAPIEREIPKNISDTVKEKWPVAISGNSNPSSGTSIILPALERLNLNTFAELTNLKTAKLDDKSHFEVVFLTDGVPKPHALHIEKAARLIWSAKKEVCDKTIYPANQNCSTHANSNDGWVAANGSNCFSRCSTYLKNYIDMGTAEIPTAEKPVCTSYYSIPYACNGYSDGSNVTERWSKEKMKCGQCFEMLYQFSFTKGGCKKDSCLYSFGQDTFKSAVRDSWGDWTQNRHAEIIGRLKTTENIFKTQFPESFFKMNFLRIDSVNPLYETQAGELIKELNWIEKAKDYFIKNHRFLVVKEPSQAPSLFSEFQDGQKYELNKVYLYLRNARSQQTGNFLADSDGDGLADSAELKNEVSIARTNGVCLDIIRKTYSTCITDGCNPKIDIDGDGLNQCEEKTIGTDDFDPDSDSDGIIDGAEILYGLNPTQNDQLLKYNTDGFSNFDHFIKGFSPKVNLKSLNANKLIKISTTLLKTTEVIDDNGVVSKVPSYSIKVDNIPYLDLGTAANNQVIVVLKIDNLVNPEHELWLANTYQISKEKRNISINLGDFQKLNLESP